jgi:DnaJ-class molecular chaperone
VTLVMGKDLHYITVCEKQYAELLSYFYLNNSQLNQTKKVQTCLHCLGSGLNGDYVKCAFCQGTGRETIFVNCLQCDGKKTIERTFKVKIPQGIHDGQTLSVPDRGNLMPDMKIRGDVYMKIIVPNVSEDGLFTRQGDNLHIKVSISVKEALMGFHKKRCGTHLSGRPLYLNQVYGQVIKPNSTRIIPGQGMPIFGSKPVVKYGELHIKFDVVFPDTVNILESPSDKKVIDLLFETPEEKLAKENAIVIDDDNDDEVDEVEPVQDMASEDEVAEIPPTTTQPSSTTNDTTTNENYSTTSINNDRSYSNSTFNERPSTNNNRSNERHATSSTSYNRFTPINSTNKHGTSYDRYTANNTKNVPFTSNNTTNDRHSTNSTRNGASGYKRSVDDLPSELDDTLGENPHSVS